MLINYCYFKSRYPKTWITSEEFDNLIEQAQADIHEATLFRVNDRLTEGQLVAVKKAIAAQVKYLAETGGDEVAGPVSIGKFSYGGGRPAKISKIATGHLLPTGLLYRGLC